MSFNCSKNIVPGGWIDIERDSKDATDAYDFLKRELNRMHPGINLIRIVNAKSQVAAGYNIALICEYSSVENQNKGELQGIIYVDLKNRYSLSELKLPYKKDEPEDDY